MAKIPVILEPPYTCLFCGMPSWVDPSDQSPPPDYCHESDHGDAEDYIEYALSQGQVD